ncbi:MAG: hypothetical protein PHO74_06195 [Weeksellaceae bacterium]|jgi:predicted  nucleic acid-binding Zn-ribbon protein|nr:hypothetical protein [Weeksellaceae bacterium]
MAKKVQQKEMSVEEKLRALYDLQLIDSRLDEIRNTRGELPLEVEDLGDDVAQMETRIQKIEDDIKNLENNIKSRKEDIKASEALIKKYTKQQDNVRNNREFESLGKEIEYQELEIQFSEKKIKELNAKITHKKENKEDVEEKLSVLKEHYKHKKSELDKIIGETEREEAFLQKKSDEFAAVIDERLLKAYKRIRSTMKNGLAVVPVHRDASFGSFFTIPPQRQLDIAQRKKIISDEHSGRILVDQELAEEEKLKIEELLKK